VRKLVFICIYLSLTIPCAADVIYVDNDANGLNDGSSWTDAYNYLQDALAQAQYYDEIFVAEGTYYPDPNGLANPKKASLQMKNGVAIFGGFPTGGSDFENRDPNLYETILSGDMGTPDNPFNNCFHVFYHPAGLALDPNAILDGFTITAGNADSYPLTYGGGMFNENSNPTVISCTFTGNSAFDGGGGMYNLNSSPTVTNCTFSDNDVSCGDGGGMLNNEKSSPGVTNCTFNDNSATFQGGGMVNLDNSSPTVTNCTFTNNYGNGMSNLDSSPTLTNCTFIGNSTGWGGGMFNYYFSSPTVTNCTFTSNSGGDGGGMFNVYYSDSTVTNCTFKGNSAVYGGGLNNLSYSNPTVTNCTFTGNLAYKGGGMYNNWYNDPIVTNCNFTGNSADYGGGMYNNYYGNPKVTNCIFWGNTAANGNEIALTYYSTIYADYCDVQGNLPGIYDDGVGTTINWGAGNIDADSLFVDPGYWDENGTPSDPNDDFWVDGDYHLKSQGWRWDNDANNWTWDDVTSPCIDAGNPGALLGDEPMTLDVDPLNRWGQNLRINMGAYGGTAEASMPPYDWALLADLTNDGIVNLEDFANQAKDWQNSADAQPGDLNRDGTVDINDALLMANDWLKTTSWY
jgi:hypothetical protein